MQFQASTHTEGGRQHEWLHGLLRLVAGSLLQTLTRFEPVLQSDTPSLPATAKRDAATVQPFANSHAFSALTYVFAVGNTHCVSMSAILPRTHLHAPEFAQVAAILLWVMILGTSPSDLRASRNPSAADHRPLRAQVLDCCS